MADIDNSMRRLLAHLATPRTVDGLTERLRVDPDAGSIDVGSLLEEADDKGWVANLGGGEPDGIVTATEKKSLNVVGFGKGQAKIWQTRAEAGLYDTSGDFYMLTEDGLDALRGPQDDGGDDE
jgi:hypothetical protein